MDGALRLDSQLMKRVVDDPDLGVPLPILHIAHEDEEEVVWSGHRSLDLTVLELHGVRDRALMNFELVVAASIVDSVGSHVGLVTHVGECALVAGENDPQEIEPCTLAFMRTEVERPSAASAGLLGLIGLWVSQRRAPRSGGAGRSS